MSSTLVIRALIVLAFVGLVLSVRSIAAAEPTPNPETEPGVRPRPAEARRPPAPTRVPAQPTPASDLRVWPLPPGTFSFSQGFGCVPQLGFYAAVAGCPAEAPAFHGGIDLAAPSGTLFYAAASGVVTSVGPDRPGEVMNTQIVIAHDGANAGYATEYLHWRTAFVYPGQSVAAGQAIGEVGTVGFSTGSHLHFTVIDLRTGGRIDPLAWLPADPSGGVYLGIAPDSVFVSYPDVAIGIPDYADPEPPPVPAPDPIDAPPPPNNAPPPADDTPPPDPAATPTPTPSVEPPPEPLPTEPPPEPTAVPTDVPTEEPPPPAPIDEPPPAGNGTEEG